LRSMENDFGEENKNRKKTRILKGYFFDLAVR